MPPLSLWKIYSLIIAVILLLHLKSVLWAISRIYNWFTISLGYMSDFPKGAQAAIAFGLIAFVLVFIDKTINK